MIAPKHPSGIKQSIVEKGYPARTALVVVDLDTEAVTRVDDEIRAFVPRINALT